MRTTYHCPIDVECIRKRDVSAERFSMLIHWAVRVLWWESLHRSHEHFLHPGH